MVSRGSKQSRLNESPSRPESDDAVAVGVEDAEDLPEVLLGRAVGHDVHDDHELGEADAAVAVLVVHVEYALLQPLQVPPRVARPHQQPEVLPVDVAIGALLAEVGELNGREVSLIQ